MSKKKLIVAERALALLGWAVCELDPSGKMTRQYLEEMNDAAITDLDRKAVTVASTMLYSARIQQGKMRGKDYLPGRSRVEKDRGLN